MAAMFALENQEVGMEERRDELLVSMIDLKVRKRDVRDGVDIHLMRREMPRHESVRGLMFTIRYIFTFSGTCFRILKLFA